MSDSLLPRDERDFSVFRLKGGKELVFSQRGALRSKKFIEEIGLFRIGGIIVIFLLFTKRLIILQYTLGSVEGSLSF